MPTVSTSTPEFLAFIEGAQAIIDLKMLKHGFAPEYSRVLSVRETSRFIRIWVNYLRCGQPYRDSRVYCSVNREHGYLGKSNALPRRHQLGNANVFDTKEALAEVALWAPSADGP